MKRLIVLLSLTVMILLLLSACSSKMDTTIDLASFKKDNGIFSYKNLSLNDTYAEAAKTIGYKLTLLQELTYPDNTKVSVYEIDKDFKLFGYTVKPTFEFKDAKLVQVQFSVRQADNTSEEMEALYTKCIKELTAAYPEATEIIEKSNKDDEQESESEAKLLKYHIKSYQWTANSENLKTNLFVQILTMKNKLLTISINIAPNSAE